MIMKENLHLIESIPYSIRNAIKRTADKNEKFSGTKYKKLNERIHDWFNQNLWITPKALFYLIKNNLTELPFCEYCKKIQLTPKQYELSYLNILILNSLKHKIWNFMALLKSMMLVI